MAKTSSAQRKTTGRVMHEFAHGELKSGAGGKAGPVKNRRQAIAIALKEAGASKYESKAENKENLAKSKRKESRGQTYQQEAEGKSHVGAQSRRRTSSSKSTRSSKPKGSESSRTELYRQAQARDIPGRSRMSKQQLENALR